MPVSARVFVTRTVDYSALLQTLAVTYLLSCCLRMPHDVRGSTPSQAMINVALLEAPVQ